MLQPGDELFDVVEAVVQDGDIALVLFARRGAGLVVDGAALAVVHGAAGRRRTQLAVRFGNCQIYTNKIMR